MSLSLFNFIYLFISILCVAVQLAHIPAEDLEPKVQLKMPKVSAYLFEKDDEFQEANPLKRISTFSPFRPGSRDLSRPRSETSGKFSPLARLALYNSQNELLNLKPKNTKPSIEKSDIGTY